MRERFFFAVVALFGLAIQALSSTAVFFDSGEEPEFFSFLGRTSCRQLEARFSSGEELPASPDKDHDCGACPLCQITSPASDLLAEKQIVSGLPRRDPETFVWGGASNFQPYDARRILYEARAPPFVS